VRHSSLGRRLARALALEDGNALVELAIAIPILLLLVVGVADYARIYYTAISVANAAMAGALWGYQVNGDPAVMNAKAQADFGATTLDAVGSGRFCRCPGNVVKDCATDDCGAYGELQEFDSVTVRKDVTMLVHILGFPTTISITRTAILRAQ
jgi:hypothetical protein